MQVSYRLTFLACESTFTTALELNCVFECLARGADIACHSSIQGVPDTHVQAHARR